MDLSLIKLAYSAPKPISLGKNETTLYYKHRDLSPTWPVSDCVQRWEHGGRLAPQGSLLQQLMWSSQHSSWHPLCHVPITKGTVSSVGFQCMFEGVYYTWDGSSVLGIIWHVLWFSLVGHINLLKCIIYSKSHYITSNQVKTLFGLKKKHIWS